MGDEQAFATAAKRSCVPLLLWCLIFAPGRTKAAEVAFHLTDAKGQPVADAVVSLVPLETPAKLTPPAEPLVIAQQKQEFVPYVTAVQVGTSVMFPNQDTVQHHVYSLSKAKKFEFARYSPGKNETILFDKAGIVTVGCNIHDSMLAYLVVLDTPWFAKSDAAGRAALDAPAGRYRLEIWHPRLPAPETRELTLPPAGATLPLQTIALALKPDRRIRRAPTAPGGGYK